MRPRKLRIWQAFPLIPRLVWRATPRRANRCRRNRLRPQPLQRSGLALTKPLWNADVIEAGEVSSYFAGWQPIPRPKGWDDAHSLDRSNGTPRYVRALLALATQSQTL
jgi:hypothetical protein